MKPHAMKHRQGGAALLIAMIVLTVMTLVVTASFKLSHNNQKMVSNAQFRDESVAAANKALEQVISSPFTDAPAADSIQVDINNDGTNDYTVAIAKPTCVQSTQIATASGAGGGSSSSISVSSPSLYSTVWDLQATVVDSLSGTSTTVHQGVRVVLTQAQYDSVCT